MKSEPLLACYAQTEWAKIEINQLEAEIRDFVGSGIYEIRPYIDSKTGEEIYKFRLKKKIPATFYVRIGNILSNLRDPLDNILAIISHNMRGASNGVAFPFCTTLKDYDTSLERIKNLLPEGASDLIRSAHTYPGGNPHLRALHFLNRDKKHRVPVAPFIMRSGVVLHAFFSLKGGRLIRIRYRNGRHLIPTPPFGDLGQTDPNKMPIFLPNQGYLLEPGAGDDETEIVAVAPGTQFGAYFKPSVEIAFVKAPGLEREPIGIALHQMRELVEGILAAFEARFF